MRPASFIFPAHVLSLIIALDAEWHRNKEASQKTGFMSDHDPRSFIDSLDQEFSLCRIKALKVYKGDQSSDMTSRIQYPLYKQSRLMAIRAVSEPEKKPNQIIKSLQSLRPSFSQMSPKEHCNFLLHCLAEPFRRLFT